VPAPLPVLVAARNAMHIRLDCILICDVWKPTSMGSMEQIEFVIYPDGRVEEKVTGVKGKNVMCHPSIIPSH